MEGEESRLRYVDSQVKTAPASTWVVVPTAHHPSPICALTKTHNMTSRMFFIVSVCNSMTRGSPLEIKMMKLQEHKGVFCFLKP